ncbi:hypothetical protein PG996_013471 [Apiospora saccharicola]|uniref:Uncharacterized protein n=1 Tax=Apiospora saccharicola TaxID=335842 RepID=A0ABR1U7X3_9PEZI
MTSITSRAAVLPGRRWHLLPRPRQHASFSSSGYLTNNKNKNSQNEEPQLPGFKVSDIVSTKRGRIIFYSAVMVLATMESLTWLNVAPQIFAKKPADKR